MELLIAKWHEANEDEMYTLFLVGEGDTSPATCFDTLDAVGDPFSASYKLITFNEFSEIGEQGIEKQADIKALYEESKAKARKFTAAAYKKICKQLYGGGKNGSTGKG